MRFTEFDIKKVKNVDCYKQGDNIDLLDKFKKSGLKCAVVSDYKTKKARYCATSIQATIKKQHNEYGNITCIFRRGDIYLINKAVD